MADNKKSFLLYCDLIHTIEKMPLEKAGELFLHVLRYVNDQNPVSEDLIINLTFEPIKQQLKRDLVKYECIRERNSLNARKRWDATASSGIPNDTKNADNDNDNDNDNDINNKHDLFPNNKIIYKGIDLKDGDHVNRISIVLKIDKKQSDIFLSEFLKDREADQKEYKSMSDLCTHFTNYCKKKKAETSTTVSKVKINTKN